MKSKFKNWVLRTFFEKEIISINSRAFNNGVKSERSRVSILKTNCIIDTDLVHPDFIDDEVDRAKMDFVRNVVKYIQVEYKGYMKHPHYPPSNKEYEFTLKVVK